MTDSRLLSNSVKNPSAEQRIASFRQRFGDGHFYLACHATMPIALTPDLLYSLWANFQRDTHGDAIEIPWIAVADFMLSSLCEEVGQELYEIDQEVQDELLNQLQHDSRLGLERVRELADFVMAYVEQQLNSEDLDVKDLAQGQHWRALAYKNPSKAARCIAEALVQLPLEDKAEQIRMAALLNSLEKPLSAFQPLLIYIRALSDLARGNLEAATAQITKAVDANHQLLVENVGLPIPEVINRQLMNSTEQDMSLTTSQTATFQPFTLRLPSLNKEKKAVLIVITSMGILGTALMLESWLPRLHDASNLTQTNSSPTQAASPSIPTPATPSSSILPFASDGTGTGESNATISTQNSFFANVRSGPGTNNSVKYLARSSDRVKIMGSSRDQGGYLWYRVVFPKSSVEGWIASQLVQPDAPNTVQRSRNDTIANTTGNSNTGLEDTNATIVGGSGSKNIRTGPGTSFLVHHIAYAGDRVRIIESAQDFNGYTWYRVYFPKSGADGWIAAQLVNADK